MYIDVKRFKVSQVDHKCLLDDTQSDNILILDEVSSEIWNIIISNAGYICVSDIANVICSKYEIDESVVTKDIESFINQLDGLGYVED